MSLNTNIINKVAIKIEFTTKKKLCVGAGGLPFKMIADINFMRLDDKLLIPASTIKGVLRTCMIKVSKLLGHSTKPSIHPAKIAENDDIVTRLMGKPNMMGKIRVDNVLINDADKFSLSHVKINDRKGIAEEHGLFSIEYVPEGTTFSTTIEANNIDVDEMRLLLTALVEMRNSRIGKNGMVDIRIKDIEPNDVISKLKEDEVIKILLDSLMGDKDANL